MEGKDTTEEVNDNEGRKIHELDEVVSVMQPFCVS